jgi:Tol biopolymer transport system component
MFLVSESGQDELKFIDSVSEGVLSPDNSTLAYQVSSDNGLTQNIYLLNLNSAKSSPVKFMQGCYDPDWAPDGKQIAMTCAHSDTTDIYMTLVSNNLRSPVTDCIKEGVG